MAPETKSAVESLLASEAALDRAFSVCISAVVATLGWVVCRLAFELFDASWARILTGALVLIMLAAYAWFANAVGRAATRLGKTGWLYASWVIGAPVVAIAVGMADVEEVARVLNLAPLHLKFAALVLGVSPLSLKLVLASELRTEIHDRTFAD